VCCWITMVEGGCRTNVHVGGDEKIPPWKIEF
jgi:hypothetical protein